MLRSKITCLCLSLILTSFCLGDENQDDGKTIDGTWLPAEIELAGKKLPDEIRKTMKLVVAGDKYTVTVGNKSDKGTLDLDASKSPKTIDIIGTDGPNKGKTILAIYEKSGDALRICYDLSGNDRPTEFKTKAGSQLFLVTYRPETPESPAQLMIEK